MSHQIVNRDVFARGDLVKQTVHAVGTCTWCGGGRRRKAGTTILFRYGWHADDKSQPTYDKHLFCSLDCRRDYYEISHAR